MSGSGNVSAARIRTSSAMGGASSGRGAVKSAKPRSLAKQMSKGSGGGPEPGRPKRRSNGTGLSKEDVEMMNGAPRQVVLARGRAANARRKSMTNAQRREELRERFRKLKEEREKASKVVAELTHKFWVKRGKITPAESRRNARATKKLDQIRYQMNGIKNQLLEIDRQEKQ